MGRLVCREDGSNKFWEGRVKGNSLVTSWGRVGTQGQSKTKVFASAALAKDELTKLEREKRGKGYVDEGATPKIVSTKPAGKGKAGAKAPSGPTGKPIIFEDTNLALAILDACIDAGLLEEPDFKALQAANPYEEGEDEYTKLNFGVAFDLAYYLVDKGRDAVGKVERIRWVVPRDVMFACWPQWDGESDEFELTNLQGIERCVKLRSLHVQHFSQPVDLAPLTRLPALEEVKIDWAPGLSAASWRTLLDIPKLKNVYAEVPADVAKKLRAKGIKVAPA